MRTILLPLSLLLCLFIVQPAAGQETSPEGKELKTKAQPQKPVQVQSSNKNASSLSLQPQSLPLRPSTETGPAYMQEAAALPQ